MSRNSRIFLIILLLICVLLLIGVLIYAIVFEHSDWSFSFSDNRNIAVVKEESFPVEELKIIELSLLSSDVIVKPTSGSEVIVRQYSGKKVDEDRLFSVSISEDKLTVKEKEKHYFYIFRFSLRSGYYEVEIPEQYHNSVKITTVSGNIDMTGNWSFSESHFQSTSGDITAKGNIISQEFYGKTISGEIDFEDIEANNIFLKTTSGDIECKNLEGSINVKTVSGEVEIDSITDRMEISTTSGDIRVKSFLMKEKSNIKTVSGNVKVVMNSLSNAEVQSDTVSGNVSLPNHSSIIGNAPFEVFKIKTTSGDITIQKQTS